MKVVLKLSDSALERILEEKAKEFIPFVMMKHPHVVDAYIDSMGDALQAEINEMIETNW